MTTGIKNGTFTADSVRTTGALKIQDTDDSNTLNLVWNEDDSSDRVLNLLLNAASRSLTLNSDISITYGTFTPALTSTGGGETVTYDTRFGYYVKVGVLVFVYAYIDLASFSDGSGGIRVTVPVTCSANWQKISLIASNFSSTTTPNVCQIIGGGTGCKLLYPSSADARDESEEIIITTDLSGDENIAYFGMYEAT